MTPEPTAEVVALTDDDARASVARSVAKSLRNSIEQLEAQPAAPGTAAENKEKMLQAAREIHDSMLLVVKKLEQPRILRPDRSIKVARFQ